MKPLVHISYYVGYDHPAGPDYGPINAQDGWVNGNLDAVKNDLKIMLSRPGETRNLYIVKETVTRVSEIVK
jgi:hypothetical protein